MMGYLSISSKRDSDANVLESRVTISDADIDRITKAYAGIYFPNGIEDAPGMSRQPTGQEVFDAVANGLLDGILANTVNAEKAEAIAKAHHDIAPISVNNPAQDTRRRAFGAAHDANRDGQKHMTVADEAV